MIQTFEQSAQDYLAKLKMRKRKPVKATTLATFNSAVKLALQTPGFGSRPLDMIDNEDLRQLVERIGQKSPHTINLTIRVVKSVVASAVDHRGNQLFARKWNHSHIDLPPVTNLIEKEVLKAEDVEAAIAAAPQKMKTFIAVQAASGLRRGEMLALNIDDFDPVAGTLRVDETAGYYGVSSPKTKSANRVVDIHPLIVDLLIKASADHKGTIFPVTADTVRRTYERLNIRTHDLRHFRYTHLQRAEIPNAIRDFWIGHATKGMERVYGHVAQDNALKHLLVERIGIGFNLAEPDALA
jgi:integrase